MNKEEQELVNKWANFLGLFCAAGNANKLYPWLQILCQEFNEIRRVPQYDSELKAASEENKALRNALSLVATNIGNGSFAVPDASLEFLTVHVPEEVRLVIRGLKAEINELDIRLLKISEQPVGNLFITRQKLETANRAIDELESDWEEQERMTHEAEKSVRAVKNEAEGYRQDHLKLVDWLCENGYGESCGNPADNVLNILKLIKEKSEIQTKYIQNCQKMGWDVAVQYQKETQAVNDQLESAKICK